MTVKYTADQLANFLINNDYEVQIIRREVGRIFECMAHEEIDVTREVVEEAIAIALEDAWIQTVASDLNLESPCNL